MTDSKDTSSVATGHAASGMLSSVPAELRDRRQWACADASKRPWQPDGRPTDTTEPRTWSSFEACCEAVAGGRYPYLGFVFGNSDPYFFIDLDDKVEKPATAEDHARFERILERFPTYTERSASGSGLHLYGIGKFSGPGLHRDHVEVYCRARFAVVTGDVSRPLPLTDCQAALDILLKEMRPDGAQSAEVPEGPQTEDDEAVLEKARGAANADKFNKLWDGEWEQVTSKSGVGLYPSQSEADLALLSMLCFHSRNNEQVKRLFRMSALGQRSKATKDDKYLDRSVAKVRASGPPEGLTLAEVIAGLDEKAKENPDSAGWRAHWRPLLYRARLPAGDVNAVLDHLVDLGVGNKRPLSQEWKDYLGQQEEQAAVERAELHLRKTAGDRPVITYDPLDFNKLVPAVEQAMLTRSELLRVDKAYVTVLEDVLPGTANVQQDQPPPKQVSLVPMTINHMRLRVERDVCLVTVGEDGLEHPTPVPRDLASMLLEYLYKQAPAVMGLVQHPIMLPTGRLITDDGYDMRAGLYVAKGGWDFKHVAANPTRDEARRAAEYVRQVLLGEVMLRDRQVDGTAVLAALLAGMSRKATEKGPSVLITAACQGTGKTTLAQMIHVLLTGRDMPVQPMVRDSTEFEKQMLSTLMRSPPMVCFDNVPDGATLDSDLIGALAAVMTSPVYQARLLGQTLLVSAPTNVLWVFTGNSVTVGADFVRRFIQVDLLAAEVRPEQHRYAHADPVQYAKSIRSGVIAALLTVQRAWFAAGCPEGGRSFGMGKDFDSLVTWPLEHAGQEGLFDKLEVTREQSPELQAKRALVLAFRACYGTAARRAADVMRDVATDDERAPRELSPQQAALREAIESGERKRLYNLQSLGRFLGTLVDVKVEDPDRSLVLTMKRKAGGGSVYWYVEAVPMR